MKTKDLMVDDLEINIIITALIEKRDKTDCSKPLHEDLTLLISKYKYVLNGGKL